MATVRDIFAQMDQWAPFETQMDFDNAGFLVGRGEREVPKILVSLDITEPVADEAADWGADLIVAHHPVIFHPVKRLTDGLPPAGPCWPWRSGASPPSAPTPTWTPPRGRECVSGPGPGAH